MRTRGNDRLTASRRRRRAEQRNDPGYGRLRLAVKRGIGSDLSSFTFSKLALCIVGIWLALVWTATVHAQAVLNPSGDNVPADAPAVTRQDSTTRRAQLLPAMEEVMGPLPSDDRRVDLNVRVEQQIDVGSYVRRLITFQSEPESRTPAYLCIPKTALRSDFKAPAVLCLHPTDNRVGHQVVMGLGGRAGRQYAAELAERGYITLAPAYPHLANYWPNLGKLGYVSGTMKAIWDNTRALDLLASMPQVDDRQGFGAIGHSLGGHNAIFTAVFDQRISVIVSSCGFDSFADYYDGDEQNWYFGKGWCQIRYMPRLSNYRGKLDAVPFDFPDLLASLSPRTMFINAPLHDSNFRWKSVTECVRQASAIYQQEQAADHLILRTPDCGHDFPQELREEAYRVIGSVLDN